LIGKKEKKQLMTSGANAEIQAAIEANEDYIKNEVLANKIVVGGVEKGVVLEEGDLEGVVVEVGVVH